MCGRFSVGIGADPELLAAFFSALQNDVEFKARYNVAPTQDAVLMACRPDGTRVFVNMRWGLVPSWAKDTKIGAKMINARVETADKKASFKKALAKRRALVPADGFFEWKRVGKAKQPYHIKPADGGPMAFAALWEKWKQPSGDTLLSFTILTRDATDQVRDIHDRQPVILPKEAFDDWLSDQTPMPQAHQLAQEAKPPRMVLVPVSKDVNDPKNDDAHLIERAEEAPTQEPKAIQRALPFKK